MNNYVHTHVHSVYSFLDGAAKLDDLANRVKELGMDTIALTDHNSLGGIPRFVKTCKKAGIKPLLGVEGYWTEDSSILSKPSDERNELARNAALAAGAITEEDIETLGSKKAKKEDKDKIKAIVKQYAYDTSQYHILFLAMNQTGWNNLVKLQSEAADTCTFNGRYLCDDKLLEKYHEGIIMTSACISSKSADLIIEGKEDEALNQIMKWHKIFGDRFYLEIQPLSIDKQWATNLCYIRWAKEYGFNLITSNDVHYVLEEDHDDHDTLLCVGTGAFKVQVERMHYSNDFWLRSRDEMLVYFGKQADDMIENEYLDIEDRDIYIAAVEQAMNSTVELAASCDSDNIKLGSDKPLFPDVKIPYGFTSEDWLTMKAWKGLYKYLKEHPEYDRVVYEKQMRYELEIINSKGFAPYFLTVEEYTQYSESVDNPVGPGRGSAAGSLVLYILGITKNIDPIQYDLMFERFLTPERTAPPDVDLDFSNLEIVVHHLEEVYSKESTCHVGMYGTMGVKSGLKDFGRVLGISFDVMNNISKTIGGILDIPKLKFRDLDDLKETDPTGWAEFNKLEQENKELFRLARRFEGIPRQFGIHPSGILVTPNAVTEFFPTRKDSKTGVTIALWDKDEIEEFNGIKFDILGLNTLTIIRETLSIIDEKLTMNDLYAAVNVNEPEIYKIINEGNTGGIFQIESGLYKGLVKDIQPQNIGDIIVTDALGRPGPIKSGMPAAYARRKRGEEEAKEPLRDSWEFVKDTYGVIAYQEQIMKISVKCLGFSVGQSDSIVRKIFAKKKKEQMGMLRRMMIYGKLNEEGPEGWKDNDQMPWYDEDSHYGTEIDGGIKRGYRVSELEWFWNYIEGFADYLFNKSHAACYAYLGVLTAYLKTYHPGEFMTALLSHPAKDEDVPKYAANAEQMGIKVRVPDINRSNSGFTLDKKANEILFGLSSVKGIGEAKIDTLINSRPYVSVEDALEKLPKKIFDKRVGLALIKAGAFEWEDQNRNNLINRFYEIRKDKDDRVDPDLYDRYETIRYEKEILGIPITFKPWWDMIEENQTFETELKLTTVQEKIDRNQNMMAFVTGIANECELDCVVFASTYCANVAEFNTRFVDSILIKGKKDNKGKCIINRVLGYNAKSEQDTEEVAAPF